MPVNPDGHPQTRGPAVSPWGPAVSPWARAVFPWAPTVSPWAHAVFPRLRVLPLPFFLAGLSFVFSACGGGDGSPGFPEPEAGIAAGPPSLLRVALPTRYLSGYARDLKGEVLQYHSPVPTIGTSLLVRSEDQARSIAWESRPVPASFQGEEAVFAFMIGIDVNAEPRGFDFRVDGRDAFHVRNPLQAAVGDTLLWEGEGGMRGAFHVTLMDRYGDAMGFLFLTVPGGMLRPGEPLRFEVLGESAGTRTWFMVFRDSLEPRLELQNAPAVVRTAEGEAQVLRLDLLSLEGEETFSLDSPVGRVDTTVDMGHARFLLPVPAVEEPAEVSVRYRLGEHEGAFGYTVVPPRRMEVHLHHHTHLDIGYTHRQDEVERIQWASLEEALRLGEASEGYPDGARFVWHPEGLWPVESYVRAHPGQETERLLEGIRRGWIELDGSYAGLLTGLANEETLLHAFDAARALSEMSGVPIRSELLSDIPGFSWGLVEALARNGIRYLSIGPNFGHRIGHFTEALGDRPFWWEGPSGDSRVLTWVSGGGYAWFHTGLGYDSITEQLDEEKVFRFLDELFSREYPYELTYLRYNIGSDNGPPDPGLADAVRRWNERYASPVLRIAGATETFQAFEERYGAGLPTLRGDLTGYWEDGAASSARETAMVRRVAEELPQTERLAALRGVSLDEEMLEEAWRQVLLFYEHTWGSWNSVSEPYSELTLTSWERKRGFAEEARTLADRLRDQALGERGGREAGGIPGRPAPGSRGAGAGSVEVFNTLRWPRTDLVTLPPEDSPWGDRVLDEGGVPVPSQRLATGELAFLVVALPGESSRTYTVSEGEAFGGRGEGSAATAPPGSPGTDLGRPAIQVSTFTLRLDPETGVVASLVHRPTGRELVDRSGGGFNGYLYVPGRDPADVVGSGPARVAVGEGGPLVWSLVAEAPAPGLRGLLEREIRLVEGLDRVFVRNRVPKAWVLEPEAVLFRFPFHLQEPQVRIDVPFGSFRPELDQLPGASRNYFSLQRWVDLSDAGFGVTVTSIDAPLVQLGEVRTDAIVTGWLETVESSPVLLSYVMNNYWETNYRAAQDDEVTFRYTLRPHGGFREEEAERFGLEDARPLVYRVVRRAPPP